MDDGTHINTITGKARNVTFDQENKYEEVITDFYDYTPRHHLSSVVASTTIDWAWDDDKVYTWKEEPKVKEKKLDRSKVNVVTHNDNFTYEARGGDELKFRVDAEGRLIINQGLDVFAIINAGEWISIDYV